MKKLLIVEDEESIAKLLKYNLEKEGYDVSVSYDGEDGYDMASSNQFDLILLDWMLPKMDGIEVTKRLKQAKVDTPIIMLTAKDGEIDKILGLEMGADDYMTKPFSLRELIARIRSVMRRYQHSQEMSSKRSDEILKFGHLEINPKQFEVKVSGEVVSFTPKEFELLLYLAENEGHVFTREQLLNAVWNYDFAGETRIVDVHISHLREKIEMNTKQPQHIVTVRGFGYKFEGGQ
ncbi:response regulator transcription factor [Allofustis seminis]|uniref:response regulator transcription factor n=1 Tax=Allofustis seminis TaxID=166939 RepID=UPI0003661C6E|nr:response regulator transcription factor [Allofustis seminis]